MSPPPESSPAAACTSRANEFSPQERALLLNLALEAIHASLEQREISLEPPSSHLAQPRGVFTTLYIREDLRGCVGYITPGMALYCAVAETARGAAFEDTRFWPVTRDELPGLRVSLSILSPLQPIHPDAIEIGRHGLLISLGFRRGLLLPQVAVEHGWNRIRFLDETCRKAGLPPAAWMNEASIEAFTAEVFSDTDPPS
jgi:AmmeMemoRadiSam system protein A